MSFVHLRVHSEYSLLSSSCRIQQLVDAAVEDQMSALALTDAGNMFGAVEFYQKCEHKGIKPIIGLEANLVSGSRFEKKTAKDGLLVFRIGLLAKDHEGYCNLMKLASIGYMEGFYYRPRIDMEVLSAHSKGLILLSGFARGPMGYYFMSQQDAKAEEMLGQFKSIFSPDDICLELQRHQLPEREIIIQKYQDIAHRHQLKLVATNDVYYPSPEDFETHEVQLCLQSGKTLDDESRVKMPSREFYFKTAEQMKALFRDIPEAIENTVAVAEKCQMQIDFTQRYLPKFPLPEGQTNSDYLKDLCYSSMNEKYPEAGEKERDRLEFELKTINDMGFADYFLIVSDFIRYAKSQGIPVGPGRGSAAGSIVSYLMDITNLDPLRYDLLFERFLNPARISMPDIDIDFCKKRRNDVIDYVTQKYGRECVAQIITFGTMAARMVVRDVGRVLNVPLIEVDQLAKFIPSDPGTKLKKALAEVDDLKNAYEQNSTYRRLFDIALKLEGMVRQPGIHAAGIIISASPLTDMTPLYRSGEDVTTQYEAGRLEELGLLKMDFLGLKNLTIISDALEMIRQNHGVEIDINQIPMEDKASYDLLSAGQTIGVFQLESDGMRNLARNMGVENFEVIVALLALYRPGPLDWAPDFIERKKGLQPIEYSHPLMEPILKETFGVMLYQEQVMQSVSELAGFTLAEADLLRRAMGKKKVDVMEAQREKFVVGCQEKNNIDAKLAHKIFDNIYKFAGYGFNKSHSVAYALISYQTAYLKANYPVEYMAALLSNSMDNTDKVVLFIEECRLMGIQILPPDVNESMASFTVVQEGIRFGLNAIKNVGESPTAAIIEERLKQGPFKSLFEFCKRIDLRTINKKTIESLIKAGAMDSFGARRSQMMHVLERAIEIAQKEQKDAAIGQSSLFELIEEEGDSLSSDWETFPDLEEWGDKEKLGYEKELVGFYLTGHPLREYEHVLKLYATENSASIQKYDQPLPASDSRPGRDEGTPVQVGGLIVDVRTIMTRKGDKMAFVKLQDLEGDMEITVFPKTFENYSEFLVVDHLVFVDGKASLNKRNNSVQVLASKIVPLEIVESMHTGALKVSLSGSLITEDVVQKLRQICLSYHGDCPLKIDVFTEKGELVKIEAGEAYWVDPKIDLKNDIEHLVGAGTVSMERAVKK